MIRPIAGAACALALFVLPTSASAEEANVADLSGAVLDLPEASGLSASAAASRPAPVSRPGGWVAWRPEAAVAVFVEPAAILMQRGQVAVGGQGRNWSMYGTFDVGRLWFPGYTNPQDGAWLAQWGIVPSGVIRVGRTDVHVGGRLDLTAVQFIDTTNLRGNADAGPMVTLGPTVAFVTKPRVGPGIRVAIEPGIVLPWVTHTIALSVGMAF